MKSFGHRWTGWGCIAALICACVASSAHAQKTPEDRKQESAVPVNPGAVFLTNPTSLEGIFLEKDWGPLEEEMEPAGDRTAPANDACANATIISGAGSFAFDNSMATTDGLPHFFCNFFGQNQITRDLWYRWTAPQTASYTVDTCTATTIDTKLAIYTIAGACPPTDNELLECNDDACSNQSRIVFTANAGEVFRIRVGSFPGQAGGPGTLKISFQGGQDLCGQPAGNCQAGDNTNGYEASGNQVYDDFRTTGSGGTVTRVCVSGAYFDGFNVCSNPGVDSFSVAYYTSVSGLPSFSPFAEFMPQDLTVTGPVPTGQMINGTIPVVAHTITHPPVVLQANRCYWIRVRNILPGGTCSWYWQRGQPGNSIAFQTTDFVASSNLIAADMAFCFNIPIASSTICQSATVPANDECANATVIFCGNAPVIQNLFATDNPSDPPFSCRLEGPGRGSGTLWYRFQASATSAAVSICGTTRGDSMLAVYSGTCGNLVEIACNDDYCGRRSLVRATGLTVGQFYYIQFATFDLGSRGEYVMSLSCPAPPPPANDACANAQLVTLDGFGNGFATGSTIFATPETTVPGCGFSPLVAPSIWFKVIGTGTEMFAGLCTSNFDTKLSIYCGASCSELICVAQNDDFCGNQSGIEWCTELGRTYYILAHGFNGQVGQASLNVFSFGDPCTEQAPCTTCLIGCPPGAIPEIESCGDNLNGGCNSSPVAVQQIPCGSTVCGTAWAFNNTRDTDWYEFTVTAESLITWSVTADLPLEIYILDNACPPKFLASALVERCGTGAAQIRLNPGVYRAFVGNVFDAYSCGSFNSYTATLSCEPIGACCTGIDCIQTSQSNCQALAGQFGGAGSECDITYSANPTSSAFEDIFPTGTVLNIPNDNGEVVDVGFSFRLYGRDFTKVGIAADGYLAFESSLSVAINAPIPSASAPNHLIAPLWDDFVPFPSGAVQYEVLGDAPNRRFIAQWTDVPQFFMNDSNTFQAVLFEGTNCIEFRYLSITPQATAGDYTIGVEDRFGTRGTSTDPNTVINGTAILLCPVATTAGCQLIGCLGDANTDGRVDFDDITSVLANWGGAGPAGDANRDLAVNFDDIVSVLANWGCAPLVCLGNANGDSSVNFDDITAILANWNTTNSMGDANGDGMVNFDDITSTLANWGNAC